MKYVLSICFLFLALACFAQPSNDLCTNSKVITTPASYCSNNGEFTTVNAGDNDVWFSFTVTEGPDVSISVVGNFEGGGTLLNPTVQIYADCGTPMVATTGTKNNVTTLTKGGLIFGSIYYIRVSGSNTGTFKFCLNNFNPPIKAGQDAGTASVICNKKAFSVFDVTGAGTNTNEAAGTCLDGLPGTSTESNSAWYRWTAANNGTLTFTITPTANDDIDWVLYDLGPSGNPANATAANAIRCTASRGVDCAPGLGQHILTGLNMTSTDLSESGGCGAGKDGFVRYIDMIPGHVYALLINNFDNGNNGFKIEFGGTGEFVGPTPQLSFTPNNICTPQQSYVFNAAGSANYTAMQWLFGEGASMSSATTPGPHQITYNTPGVKVAVLILYNDEGCSVVSSQAFPVGVTPPPPSITGSADYCTGDTIRLSVPNVLSDTFAWTGPGGFTAEGPSIAIPVTDAAQAGQYTVTQTNYGCTSTPSTFTVNSITQTPTASFRTDPVAPARLSFPVTVRFFNESQDADTYLWDFGDGNTSTDVNPQHTYTTRGRFTVTLTANAANACLNNTTRGEFIIVLGSTIFIPNTFTPNADGINDQFVVSITNLKTYKITIFNRYGETLYTSTDIFEHWDGTYKGQPMPVGTYYYVINGVDLDDEAIKQSGSVTVLR